MIKSNASKLKLTALAACLAAGLAANPANATITVYEKDGLKYKLKGDWQIQLAQNEVSDGAGAGAGGDDQNLNLEFDDLEIRNIVSYDVGNGVTAFGEVHFSYNRQGDNASSGNTFEEGFLGFDFGDHKIAFGRTNSAGDEFGVEKAYEGVGPADDAFNEIDDAGDDLIRYDGGFGPVSVAASYELEAEGEGSADGTFFDIFAAVKFGPVKLAAAYQDYENAAGTTDKEGVGISASFKTGPADFGVDFSTVEENNADDIDILNVVAGFKAGPTGYIGVGYVSQEQGNDELNGWYANYTYKFAKATNIRLIAEIGDNDGETAAGDDTDLGYFLGMRILL